MKNFRLKLNQLFIALILFFNCTYTLHAENFPLIANINGRHNTLLNGNWKFIIDPMENGLNRKFYLDAVSTEKSKYYSYNFENAEDLTVPGDWNTQQPELLYYEGTIWYRKIFNYQIQKGNRLFVHFGAINYASIVYLNGEELGEHIGGYTPFNFEITKLVRNGENSLVIKVDNKRHPEGIPESVFDWWNYGGITRPVTLIETPSTFICDYSIQLSNKDENLIEGWIQLDGKKLNEQISIEIPELKIKTKIKTNPNGTAVFDIKAKPSYWSPENPKLYTVNITSEFDQISESIGFRTIKTMGKKILLNGKEVFFRGVNIHAQLKGRSVYSTEDASILLGWAKELGCNFVRLAHYPHSEEMIRLAEQMGIMVWEEIPVYWRIQFSNPETYANAENQLEEIIARDKNRANIVIWSMANETPINNDRLEFITRLVNRTRELDDRRLISAALHGTKENKPNVKSIEDELIDVLDVVSINQYYGWFSGTPETLDDLEWEFDFQKPLLMTEFGASSPYDRHGDKSEKYTEENQAFYYEKTIEMIKRIPDLSGTCPWNLAEHRSPLRVMSGIEDSYSRAGFISSNGLRKKAFYVMKKWYDELIEEKK